MAAILRQFLRDTEKVDRFFRFKIFYKEWAGC